MNKGLLYFFLILSFPSFSQQLNVDSLLNKLSLAKEDTGKATLCEHLALAYRFTEPDKAILYGKQGVVLSRKLSFDKGIAGNCLRVSTAYSVSGKLDTAFLYLDTSLVYMKKIGDISRLGLIYLNRADFKRQRMLMKDALLDCDTALRYADQANNDDVKARVHQTIGAIYWHQQDYAPAADYIEKAIHLYRKIGNMRMSGTALNNLGIVYKEMKEYNKAAAAIEQAIHITDSLKDITNLSVYYGNYCDVFFQKGDYIASDKYADKAMEYALMQDNQTQIAIIRMHKATIRLRQKKYTEAIAFMEKALPVFQAEENMDNINLGADVLAESYAGLGNHAKAYEYVQMARVAADSLAKWKYDDDIAAMQTKFRVDEKDKEILLLAKDKEIQDQKLSKQRFFIIAAVAVAVLALMGIWLAINRNRLRQQMKELQLRNQIAADLHDEVGSSLSSINMLSQMATQTGNERAQKEILDRMRTNARETMDKMGDIVWMIKPGETEAVSLKQRMERFAYEICSSKNIGLSLQLDAMEKVRLSMDQRKNIYLIFKEAINNAVKYSGAEKIGVTTTVDGKQLLLQVKDEGKGFDVTTVEKGNGLDNMQNRALELGGQLSLDAAPGMGTDLRLSVPLSV